MKLTLEQNALGKGLLWMLGIGVALGLLLVLLPVAFLMKVFFVVMGVLVLATSIPGIFAALRLSGTRTGRVALMLSLISALVGIILIFSHSKLLLIVVGVYMVALPIVQIILARGAAFAWKAELPKLIVGCLLLILGPASALEMMFDVAGWITVALTVAFVAFLAIKALRRQAVAQKKTGGRMFVDVDGDGSVDTVYMDTTGDGKHDTARRYRNRK